MLPCVGEVQSCVWNSARLLPRICWSFARRRWTPTQLGQILLCLQHVDVATPEISSLPGWIFEGTHSPEERDTVWGGATRWRSFWDTILENLPRCRTTLPRLGRRAQFATLSCFADEEVGQRLGKLHTHSPTSILTRQARKRSVTAILAQRENPLIEISAILIQCDRALARWLSSTGRLGTTWLKLDEISKKGISVWRPTIAFFYLLLFHSLLRPTSFFLKNENETCFVKFIVCRFGGFGWFVVRDEPLSCPGTVWSRSIFIFYFQ